MRADWIPTPWKPKEVGSYLVTTAKGKVTMDRWDGEGWGLCRPRTEIKRRGQGRYRPHKAWSPLPPAYKEEEDES